MKYLLDTHTFIWLDSDPTKLSPNVTAICADNTNTLLLSLASIWEMQIKLQLGKLIMPAPLADTIHNQLKTNQIELLSIELPHILELASLPSHHKDPFDRLLVAQALVEKAVFISDDTQVTKYPIPVIW